MLLGEMSIAPFGYYTAHIFLILFPIFVIHVPTGSSGKRPRHFSGNQTDISAAAGECLNDIGNSDKHRLCNRECLFDIVPFLLLTEIKTGSAQLLPRSGMCGS